MKLWTMALLAGLSGICIARGTLADDIPADTKTVRIGVYDSRAIATAWAASRFNPIGERMKEFEAAKKANDEKKVAELEAWGKSQQRKLHIQGFGHVPVSDLLTPVQDSIRKILADKGLVAITMHCDAYADGVEVVDITKDLVQLYDPSPKTLEWVQQLANKKPLTLVEVSELSDRP